MDSRFRGNDELCGILTLPSEGGWGVALRLVCYLNTALITNPTTASAPTLNAQINAIQPNCFTRGFNDSRLRRPCRGTPNRPIRYSRG